MVDPDYYKMVYSSDIHGNLVQYKKLLRKAYDEKADALLIGGDLTPKDAGQRTIRGQRDFLVKTLIPLLKGFNKKNSMIHHHCKVFLIFGNDDLKANLQGLRKGQKRGGYKVVQSKGLRLNKEFTIIGYPYIPLTPFKYKDWEKLDLNDTPETTYRKGLLLEGVQSTSEGMSKKVLRLQPRKNTIERDLKKIMKGNPKHKIVMMIHAPPYGTYLDVTYQGEHVGSKAVKKTIQQQKPYLTLHGHIHETVDQSGHFMQRIGKTTCIASGNDHKGSDVAVVLIDLYHPKDAKRMII